MGCITSTNFSVLVNGTPSVFFTVFGGIRKGFPPSTLLFILVIEGITMLINDVQKKGMVKGINISSSLSLTHLLFVDDVVLFGNETLDEWKAFDVLLDIFFSTSGMSISVDKFSFLYNELDEEVLDRISSIMPYKMDPIQVGFKYLGYYLNPLSYGINDWRWTLKSFER